MYLYNEDSVFYGFGCVLYFFFLFLRLPFLSSLCHSQINRQNFNIFTFKVGSTHSLCKVGEYSPCLIIPFVFMGVNFLKKKLGSIQQTKLQVLQGIIAIKKFVLKIESFSQCLHKCEPLNLCT